MYLVDSGKLFPRRLNNSITVHCQLSTIFLQAARLRAPTPAKAIRPLIEDGLPGAIRPHLRNIGRCEKSGLQKQTGCAIIATEGAPTNGRLHLRFRNYSVTLVRLWDGVISFCLSAKKLQLLVSTIENKGDDCNNERTK